MWHVLLTYPLAWLPHLKWPTSAIFKAVIVLQLHFLRHFLSLFLEHKYMRHCVVKMLHFLRNKDSLVVRLRFLRPCFDVGGRMNLAQDHFTTVNVGIFVL